MPEEPLSLERYYFSKVTLEATETQPTENKTGVTLSVSLTELKPGAGRFRLGLEVGLKPAPDAPGGVAYQGNVIVTGIFAVAANYSGDVKTLVKLSGTPVLYAAAREMIYNIASRGPWTPAPVLPMMSFQFLID